MGNMPPWQGRKTYVPSQLQRATSRTQLGWAVLRADQGYALSGGCVDKSGVGNS